MATPKSPKAQTPPLVLDEAFQHVKEIVDDASSSRTVWIDNQVKWNKLRMRIKKAKTFPFVGCSNIRLPTAEIKIRKVKAALYNVIFGIRPIVQATPPPAGSWSTALKIEKFLDHLMMEKMTGFMLKCLIAIDQETEQGFYLISPYWRLEITKRQETFDINDLTLDEAFFLYDGKTTSAMIREFLINKFDMDMNDYIADENEAELENVLANIHKKKFDFRVQDVTYNCPDIELFAPERCYVPADSPMHPQDCQCLVLEYYMPFHRLETNAKHFGWDINGVSEIGEYRGKNWNEQYQREQNKDIKEGIERLNSPSSLVRIWRYTGWYDIDDDGEMEKAIIICAPDFNKTLHKHALPFLNGKFNVIKLFYELTDNRWFAHRGLVEIAEDIIKEIDIQHMMKLDQQTIRNAPMFIYRAGMVNPNLIQMIPNQAIPVGGLQPLRDTVDVLNNTNPNAEFSYDREQQILDAKMEELTGQIDFTLQSQINRRQPRTLGEVQFQVNNSLQVFGLDAALHTEQFTELFNFIWDLWSQYGPDEYEFAYFGPNGWEPIKLSKEEIQGKYSIKVRGNDRNTNPQIRLQKASQIITAATNPLLIQSGVITPVQIINALKRFYQYLDVENWEELVNLQWQPPQSPGPEATIQPNFEELTDAEKAQVLSSTGVQPDVEGRALRKGEDIAAQLADGVMSNNRKEAGNGRPRPRNR